MKVAASAAAGILSVATLVVLAAPAQATTKVSAKECAANAKYLKLVYTGGQSCYEGAGSLVVDIANVTGVRNDTSVQTSVQVVQGSAIAVVVIAPHSAIATQHVTVHAVHIA